MAEDPRPVEFLPPHLPRTELEQLTDALNAGHLTPELFELAKEKLVRAAPIAPPPTTAADAPPAPKTPPGEYPAGELPPLASLLTEPPPADLPATVAAAAQPAAVVPTPAASVPLASSTAWALQAEPAQAAVPAPASRPVVVPTVPVAPPVARSPASYEELLTNATRQPPRPEKAAASPPAEASSQPAWLKAALVVIILGVLVLIYREVVGSHPDEQLTSPRQPRAEAATAAPRRAATTHLPHRRASKSSVAKKPAATPALRQAKASKPVPPAAVATAKTKPPIKLAPAPSAPAAPAGTPPEPMPQPIAAAPEAGDSEGATRVRAAMAAYYADMLAPPFAAAQHFAPHVERLYIQQNLTPADIDANFARSFFPDNQQAVFQIEPGTLRVSPPVTDGSRAATFVERARIYHPSRRGYQRLRAQVRVRFNADYQIVYLRQERLLESAFE